ncbi:MAG: helicase C-terminal domain-containing protein, partial [bacterium]
RDSVDTTACAQAVENLAEEVEEATGKLDDEMLAAELDAGGRRLRLAAHALRVFAAAPSPDSVRWLERPDPGRVTLQSAPLSIAERMREAVYSRVTATVLTSATLTVTESFDFFASRLGLDGFSTVRLDSPFDYENNCLVYVPAALPRPNAPQFAASAAGVLGRILAASRGRALVLFTSYESLNAVHALVPDTGFAHLKQGDEPPPLLLEKFRTDTHSVLFATQSFWQGVDVPGDSLSCLVIVRLPFEVPDDPRLTAICEELKAAGREPFTDYQIPTAVLRFRQGFGRLIRSATDRGAVVVLDRRIIEQPYGRSFLRSLPPGIRLADRFDDFERFFSPADGA